jgi:hypothetical protein
MSVGFAIGSLGVVGILGLVGCAGASGSTSVNGTDPAALRNAPAGVTVMVFLDLEGIRPDQIKQGATASLSQCIQASPGAGVITYHFNNCKAANEGVLNGTITVTGPVAGNGGVQTYTEGYNLTATTTLANNATQTWAYSGLQLLTFTGSTARVALANANAPIQAVFTDSAVPANNKSYAFSPNLSADLSDPARTALSGSYSLARSTGDNINCTIAQNDPLVWIPAACETPSSGSLTLALVSANGNDQATAAFNSGCGNLSVSGAVVALGGQ